MEELQCGICYEAEPEETGELDCCAHIFCFACISQWASIESRCPMCKLRFRTLRHKRLATPRKRRGWVPGTPLPGKVLEEISVPERNQKVVFEDPTFQTWIDGLHCQQCGGGDHEDELLLCDGCDTAWHTYCVGIETVPDGQWFCPQCESARISEASQPRRRLRRASELASAAPLVDEEAEEEGPRWRTRHRQRTSGRMSEADELEEEEEEESDDGFIVDDDEEEEEATFSTEEEEEASEDDILSVPRAQPETRQQPRLRRLRRGSGVSNQRRPQVLVEDDDDDLPLLARLSQREVPAAGSVLRNDRNIPAPSSAREHVQRISDRWQDLREGRVSFGELRGPTTNAQASPVDLLTPPRDGHAIATPPRSSSSRPVPASLSFNNSYEASIRREIAAARARGSRLAGARSGQAEVGGRTLGRSPYFPQQDRVSARGTGNAPRLQRPEPRQTTEERTTSGRAWRQRVLSSETSTTTTTGSGRHLNRGGDHSPVRQRSTPVHSSPPWRQRKREDGDEAAGPSTRGTPPIRSRNPNTRPRSSPRLSSSLLGRAIKSALLPHLVSCPLSEGQYREVCRMAARTLRMLRWNARSAEERNRPEVEKAVTMAMAEVRSLRRSRD